MKNRPRDIRDRILQLMQRAGYQPLDKVAMFDALRLENDQRGELREALQRLEKDGLIALVRKDRYVLPDVANLVTGKLEVHRNGSAHVVNEKRDQADVFITSGNMSTALHGDTVVARIMHEGHEQKPGGRIEGRVIRIVERLNHVVVGVLQRSPKGMLYVVPDDARISRDVTVHPGATALPEEPRVGDKVVVRLDPWENPQTNPEGEISEVLGAAQDPGVDMLSIIRKHNLPAEFPRDVLEEAERISETIDVAEIAAREDLREEMVVTIDPDDAKDFDDAINVERTKTGWRLGVHIADVSHYVRPGTALDREARVRGNSTYLADRVIPMLPERLSNGICSLKPGVERLTFSAFIDFTGDGRIKGARFARTVIRSAARLSYRQAFAILQGEREMPPLPPAMTKETRGQATIADGPPVPIDPVVADAVRRAWELASLLRKNRFADGSLDLDFPEVKVWLDAEGRAVKLEKIVNDISHQLIEECMLAANEVVAREIKNRRVPAVYRIHEKPEPDRLNDFREFAATYGFKAGDLTQMREVQKILADIKGAPEEFAIKLQFLKSLKRAAYATAPIGHYGLAKVNYTHFTSPIRRYADLVVHRSLAATTATAPSHREAAPHAGQLGELAEHISTTERTSADAEKDSVQLKKMEFFQRQLASRSPDEFRALVVDVRSYGLFIELPDVSVNGLIHVSDLPDDFYLFDPVRLAFTGRRSGVRFKVGDEVAVKVSRVDTHKRQIDFVPVRPPQPGGKQRPPVGRGNRPERRTSDRPADGRGDSRKPGQTRDRRDGRPGERKASGPPRGNKTPSPQGKPPRQEKPSSRRTPLPPGKKPDDAAPSSDAAPGASRSSRSSRRRRR